MDLRFPVFVANLKLDFVSETKQTELGENLDLQSKFSQKGALILKVTFGTVRINVERSLWIDHVTFFSKILNKY